MRLCQSENVIQIEMWSYENLYPQTRVSSLHVFRPMKTDIFFFFSSIDLKNATQSENVIQIAMWSNENW